jgi:anthranilate/para-aminobenzoate synthase component II
VGESISSLMLLMIDNYDSFTSDQPGAVPSASSAPRGGRKKVHRNDGLDRT